MPLKHWRRADSYMTFVFLGWLAWTVAVWQSPAWLTALDTSIANWLHHTPAWFQTSMVWYTQLGNPHIITGITLMIGLGLIIGHQSKAAVFFWVNTWLLAGYGNYLVKQLIQRPRPTAWRLVEIGGYSYPSGHSTTTTVLVLSLLVIAFEHWQNPVVKRWLFAGGLLIILLMMTSRIVVGVHYPSDTIGGALLGSCITYVSARLTAHHRQGNFNFKRSA